MRQSVSPHQRYVRYRFYDLRRRRQRAAAARHLPHFRLAPWRRLRARRGFPSPPWQRMSRLCACRLDALPARSPSRECATAAGSGHRALRAPGWRSAIAVAGLAPTSVRFHPIGGCDSSSQHPPLLSFLHFTNVMMGCVHLRQFSSPRVLVRVLPT